MKCRVPFEMSPPRGSSEEVLIDWVERLTVLTAVCWKALVSLTVTVNQKHLFELWEIENCLIAPLVRGKMKKKENVLVHLERLSSRFRIFLYI